MHAYDVYITSVQIFTVFTTAHARTAEARELCALIHTHIRGSHQAFETYYTRKPNFRSFDHGAARAIANCLYDGGPGQLPAICSRATLVHPARRMTEGDASGVYLRSGWMIFELAVCYMCVLGSWGCRDIWGGFWRKECVYWFASVTKQ